MKKQTKQTPHKPSPIKETGREILEKLRHKSMPDRVKREAHAIQQRGITPSDITDRRDLRNITTFTIDPDDAKDFDDAISIRTISEDEFEIGVHIADVSNYVKEGSAIDKEARKRTTSVYLVGQVIPMLPEELSNDLCSLVPDTDRLAMSAIFNMNRKAQIKKMWLGKTVIKSQKRFTYEEAENTIKDKNAKYHSELSILNDIAKNLTSDRMASGAIALESEEVKFILDEKGKPVKIIKKVRKDSNKLIEEFMLLANKKVAEFVAKELNKKGVFVYRVHGTPDKERMSDLASFLKSLGYNAPLKDGVISNQDLNKILGLLDGNSMQDTVYRAVTRAMAKAVYSTKNIGHYGLAFSYYTHFTSPIRRYPDIIAHRILLQVLNKEKIKKSEIHELEHMAIRASEEEKRATDAERASIKEKQAEYMSDKVGNIFEGVVSGISEWGIFVEEKNTKCEGLIRMRDLGDDFYILDEKKKQIFGKRQGETYKLGTRVKIKLKKVDIDKGLIDYVLV